MAKIPMATATSKLSGACCSPRCQSSLIECGRCRPLAADRTRARQPYAVTLTTANATKPYVQARPTCRDFLVEDRNAERTACPIERGCIPAGERARHRDAAWPRTHGRYSSKNKHLR